ncbi:GCN5-like N-acetyltransferase [Hypomontagnella submonticulosa]|nr:GCN5-like N-acetyltransferase [Hypomontagnella submonticulosa]
MEPRKTILTGTSTPQPLICLRPIAAADTYALRHAVLWPNKPPAYAQLPDDLSGHHFGAFVVSSKDDADDDDTVKVKDKGRDRDGNNEQSLGQQGELVSVISLFVDDASGAARFRKFATATPWQGKGVGSALMAYTIEAAAREGATTIWCDARQSALAFYQRFGMAGEGEPFFKEDVPYLRMSRPLP